MDFENLLSRADEEVLGELLGKSTIRLARALEGRAVTLGFLRDVLLALRTPAELLGDRTARKQLLQLLRVPEAQVLAAALGMRTTAAHRTLANTNIRRNSAAERALLAYFSVAKQESGAREGADDFTALHASYGLFPHQRRAARKVGELLREEPRRVLLHMPTGAGKTRTAMSIVADHLRGSEPGLVVWLAYSEELCEQALSEFAKAWGTLGDREVSAYRFWGDHQLSVGGLDDGIVVASLPKVYSALRSDISFINRLGGRVTMLVIDEAHQAIAPSYRLVLDALFVRRSTTSLLGLTATPGRTWSDIDEDQALADFFARRKVSLEIPGHSNPVEYLVAEGYLARARYERLTHSGSLSLSPLDQLVLADSLDIPSNLLKKLGEDDKRNLLILSKAQELATRHKRFILFAPSVENSELLAAVLRARGIAARSVTGKTSPDARSAALSFFLDSSDETRVLCNYGVLTTGFDAPRTSAVLIARPTRSLVLYSQMVGRAIRGRRAGGNEEAEIVTIVDTNLPGFGDVATAFSNWEDVWGERDGV